jgi:hypothetical protein
MMTSDDLALAFYLGRRRSVWKGELQQPARSSHPDSNGQQEPASLRGGWVCEGGANWGQWAGGKSNLAMAAGAGVV